MRAFADLLEVNVGTLSSILNGKRKLTPKMAQKFCDRLCYLPDKKRQILKLVRDSFYDLESSEASEEKLKLDNEYFQILSNWYHFAICQLVTLDHYKSESKNRQFKWISSQLGISEVEAKLAIDRLLSLGLLEKDLNGFLVRKHKKISTANKSKTNLALISWQKQLRQKAIESLEMDPISTRNMSSMTMSIDVRKIDMAKRIIEKFQDDLSGLLESGDKNEVYQLTVSLFPIQKKNKRRKEDV